MANPNASEQLSAYLDGELTDTERAQVEAALASDPALREALEALEGAVDFLRTHGPVQAPADFHARVMEAVEHEPMPGAWWRWLRRPFGLPIEGFAVALVAAVVLLVALPLGMNTGGVDDLVGDPYGFVTGDEVSTKAPAKGVVSGESSEEQAEPVAQAPAPSTKKVAPRPASSLRPAPTPAPTNDVVDAVADAGGNETPAGGADSDTTAAAGGSYAQAPLVGAAYTYTITVASADAVAQLQRIAAQYRGQVLDARGARLDSTELSGETLYFVEIPASDLARFGDDLRALGSVQEVRNDNLYASDPIRVPVRIIPMNGSGDDTSGTRAKPSVKSAE